MRYEKRHKPIDEREKLRKFRELDDAFAEALRELESGSKPRDMPSFNIAEERREAERRDQQERFERGVLTLMKEYQQSVESVCLLMRTLQRLGKGR